jgi:hypothetical protein
MAGRVAREGSLAEVATRWEDRMTAPGQGFVTNAGEPDHVANDILPPVSDRLSKAIGVLALHANSLGNEMLNMLTANPETEHGR